MATAFFRKNANGEIVAELDSPNFPDMPKHVIAELLRCAEAGIETELSLEDIPMVLAKRGIVVENPVDGLMYPDGTVTFKRTGSIAIRGMTLAPGSTCYDVRIGPNNEVTMGRVSR
jgi:hypothetical protein